MTATLDHSPCVSAHLYRLERLKGRPAVDRAFDISRWTAEIAEEFGIDSPTVDRMRDAALLMEVDRAYGPRVAGESPATSTLDAEQCDWALLSDEHWDGSGPLRLRGDEIPAEARVIAVAHHWVDAAGDDRGGLTAIAKSWRCSGRRLCPEAVRALTRLRTLRIA